jgi:hypothetical protein
MSSLVNSQYKDSVMHKFRIFRKNNPNIAWLVIEEGNINIETGIRFIYNLLDHNDNVYEKKLFVINGDDFDNIGSSGLETRIAIINLLLESIDVVLVKE